MSMSMDMSMGMSMGMGAPCLRPSLLGVTKQEEGEEGLHADAQEAHSMSPAV